MIRSVLAATVLLALAPSSALACGGFFCSSVPIDQSKEKIIFGVDEEAGTVEVHVQIFYSGDAKSFAWVVPVTGVPDVALSSDELFTQLGYRTQPYFSLTTEERGTCVYDGGGWYGGWYGEGDATNGAGGGGGAPGAGGGVDVLSEGQTGPFDWTVVSASDQTVLLEWLADPDGDPTTADAYIIPPNVGDALGTYISGGSNFVAFKLSSDASAGDIAPIKLTYSGNTATIPLVLTSIAATPDMRLEPYVFANHRAVPDNYLHVRINEAKINWLYGGQNYDDVVTEAANEAGGQAFATDFYGSTSNMKNMLWWDGRFDLATLRGMADPVAFLDAMLMQGFPRGAVTQNIIRDHIPMPADAVAAGLDESSFYNCLSCYPEYTAEIDFDANAMVDDLDERIVQPLIDANDLFDQYSQVTRMTSSMSADEMTADPMFVINPDMTDEVSNNHNAKMIIDCGDGGNYTDATRWIELQDGTTVNVPPDSWYTANGVGYDTWPAGEGQPAAASIEDTSGSGQPTPVADNNDAIARSLGEYNTWVDGLNGNVGGPTDPMPVTGCAGCDGSGGTPGLAGAMVGLLAIAGRRRNTR